MKSPLLASVIAIGLFGAPAFASSSTTQSFEMDVEYSRDALSDMNAVPTEYERIERQVSDRCEVENDGFDPIRKHIAVRRCENITMNNTIAEIDHAQLTAYHREQRLG